MQSVAILQRCCKVFRTSLALRLIASTGGSVQALPNPIPIPAPDETICTGPVSHPLRRFRGRNLLQRRPVCHPRCALVRQMWGNSGRPLLLAPAPPRNRRGGERSRPGVASLPPHRSATLARKAPWSSSSMPVEVDLESHGGGAPVSGGSRTAAPLLLRRRRTALLLLRRRSIHHPTISW
jgi:hypothetical protein